MADMVLLDAGSGGRASHRLVEHIFLRYFKNDLLMKMDDAALLSNAGGNLAMSTDSYTVTPLFFPGGSIGSLAVNGTVNDVSMLGAKPLWLSCGFIIEEGLPVDTLEKVVRDMAQCCSEAGVGIVTGDTKVVPAGACDKLFINTTGIGRVYAQPPLSGSNAMPGDAVLVSGTMGDHGLAIMAARADASFMTRVKSDSAPLAAMIKDIIDKARVVHVLRDPTRGGLATTLNEIAEQSGVCMEIEEAKIPMRRDVVDGCSFLGVDPLYLANEGKCVCVLPMDKAQDALEAMRSSPYGRDAAIIGKVTACGERIVFLRTAIGGQRILGMLEGAQLPRIC